MCMGGAKPPSPTPPPPPAAVPTPNDTNPELTADQRSKKLAAMRFGMLSTIKTGPGGVTGSGADLAVPAAAGMKTKLGA